MYNISPFATISSITFTQIRRNNSVYKFQLLCFSNTSLDQAPYVPPVVTTPQPRQVILNKVKAGFGFQMRGANGNATSLF